MRDISAKINTLRTAVAEAILTATPQTLQKIRDGQVPKGNPLEVAKVAACQAAKNTHQIIPYCHPIPIDFVGVSFELLDDRIRITAEVKAVYRTGVEMEALTAASVAALTIYDMLKMFDEVMAIEGVTLVSKKGGKSDFKESVAGKIRAAVLVISDSVAAQQKKDTAGQLIIDRLASLNVSVSEYAVVSDEISDIRTKVLDWVDNQKVDLVITTGGTGISPRDNTPEALLELLDRELPGVMEASRVYGQARTPYAMLSRAFAGVRKNSLILTLPGSKGGVQDSLDALFPGILHGFKMLWGGTHPETENRSLEPNKP